MSQTIILKKGREASILRYHPWVFSGAVSQTKGAPSEGAIVDVYAADGAYLATGHYQKGSITVRILSFDGPGLPDDFWITSLSKAYALRERLGLCEGGLETNAYRLVHGEGDHLPGLVIDFYDGVAVLQAHSAGMFLAREEIVKALKSLYGEKLLAVYDKSSGTAPYMAGLALGNGYLYQSAPFSVDDFVFWENGLRYYADWEQGQKTGFFFDQRENRALLGKMAEGARVLNLFCYSGGFSAIALEVKAALVHSVDSSARAIELLNRNMDINFDIKHRPEYCHEAFTADAFDFLKASPKGAYNLMVLDPPAFAKHTGAKKSALLAYKRLNAVAIDRIAPGGIIFTFSCSQVVDKNDFALAVFSAAAISGRKVRILYRLGQAADHPVNIYHPEGDYLKGLVLYVE